MCVLLCSNVPLTAQAYIAPVADMKKLSMSDADEDEDEANGENGDRSQQRLSGGEYCPRCDKQVFIAERKQAAGNVGIKILLSEFVIICFRSRFCKFKVHFCRVFL